ncbi:protein ethylene insensitive [Musa troglodytarum]|uniref:Protein ethylene insensitive n=1 Tax=Musa troglodytarum TaxID=320322 RepID=A0A9E7HEE7_9LILI|nr:protein ethylene insensitive [Musa troglodytarum]
MVYPGEPNYVQNISHGSLHQPLVGECNGQGHLIDPPQDNFAEVCDEESDDEDVDIEELEHRLWRDRMRLKRLKEQSKSKNKEQGDPAKQRQCHDQALRKKMSRAQDGILKYMLKMMEVCNAQGFVYGIIPEKGKPVSGASDNLRGWWKEKVRFDRNGPVAIANITGSISFLSSCSEYDVEGVDEGKCEDVVNRKLHAEGNPFDLSGTARKEKTVKEEMDVEFTRKRSVAEPEPVLNQCIYTCDNVQCPHHDPRHGFLDRNARNSHRYVCQHHNARPRGIGVAFNSFPVKESDTQPNPTSLEPGLIPAANISGLGIPSDGQRSIDELMSLYDKNLNANKSFNLRGVGAKAIGGMLEEVGNLLVQQQQQFPVRENVTPFQQQFGNPSDEMSYGSALSVPSMDYSDALHRLQKAEAANWFY